MGKIKIKYLQWVVKLQRDKKHSQKEVPVASPTRINPEPPTGSLVSPVLVNPHSQRPLRRTWTSALETPPRCSSLMVILSVKASTKVSASALKIELRTFAVSLKSLSCSTWLVSSCSSPSFPHTLRLATTPRRSTERLISPSSSVTFLPPSKFVRAVMLRDSTRKPVPVPSPTSLVFQTPMRHP